MLTGPLNFNVEKTYGDLQLELAEMQWDSMVKQNFNEGAVPNFALIYLWIDFQKAFNFHAKNVRCWQYLRM
jgi:hypothetical protein